jgi:hypothetical protein
MLHVIKSPINTKVYNNLTNSVSKKIKVKLINSCPDFNGIIRTKTLNNYQICSII